MLTFLRACVDAVAKRKWFLVVLNLVFFWSVLVSALLASAFVVPPPPDEELVSDVPLVLFGYSWVLMALEIFFFNLVLSAFVFVTLPGLVLFLLSAVMLVYRGVVWGGLLAFVSASRFAAALPTVLLEGEGYVLAAVAGCVLGLSWLKPKSVYGVELLSRRESVKRAFREGLRVYFLVAIILFIAAIAETATILLIG